MVFCLLNISILMVVAVTEEELIEMVEETKDWARRVEAESNDAGSLSWFLFYEELKRRIKERENND